MKLTTKVLGVATVLCLLAVAAVPASAAFEKAGNGQGPSGLLDEIEAAGYDVTDIRTAFENQDFETARTLMHQFMEAHQDEFAPAHGGKHPGMGVGNGAMLDEIEAAGYDISDIRTAFENGDTETAHTLLHQFMEEHHDEFAPAHDGENSGMGMGMRGHGGMRAGCQANA